jgi:hypothetical protein
MLSTCSVYDLSVEGRMLVRVDSQNRNHLATVHNTAVDSSRDRDSSTSRAPTAAALVENPPRLTRSRRPAIVDTMHSKYQDP